MRRWISGLIRTGIELRENWRRNVAINVEASRRAQIFDAIVRCTEVTLTGQVRHGPNGNCRTGLSRYREMADRLVLAREDLWVGRPTSETLATLRALRALISFHEGLIDRLDPLIEAVADDLLVAVLDGP